MIVAVSMVKNEAGIIARTVGHLLAEGVDRILIADGHSTDATRAVLSTFAEVEVTDEPPGQFDQSATLSMLAARALDEGADWVLPFDADEFPHACEGDRIVDALDLLPANVQRVYMRMFLHLDWDHRLPDPKPLPKVMFRAQPGAMVHFGNHDVILPNPGQGVWGVVDVREWQYRSWEHFNEKVVKARQLLEANPGLDPIFGSHMRRLAGMSEVELQAEWSAMCAVATVHDPIPSLLNVA